MLSRPTTPVANRSISTERQDLDIRFQVHAGARHGQRNDDVLADTRLLGHTARPALEHKITLFLCCSLTTGENTATLSHSPSPRGAGGGRVSNELAPTACCSRMIRNAISQSHPVKPRRKGKSGRLSRLMSELISLREKVAQAELDARTHRALLALRNHAYHKPRRTSVKDGSSSVS